MFKESVEMYDGQQNEEGMQFDWKKTGFLRLAATHDRIYETRRLTSVARSFDLEMEVINPAEATVLFS